MAGDWHELDNGGFFSIAGWQADGSDWHDVEKGDSSFEASPYDLADSEIIVFHYMDDGGNNVYYTVYGPFDDWDTLGDVIADTLDRYGVE